MTTHTTDPTPITVFPPFISPRTGAERPRQPGPLDALSSDAVLQKMSELRTWSGLSGAERRLRLDAAARLLNWLQRQPGDGWQARWDACEQNPGVLSWVADEAAALGRSPKPFRGQVVYGVAALLLCRIVKPSYDFLVDYGAVRLFADVRTQLSADTFVKAETAARDRGMAGRQVAEVRADLDLGVDVAEGVNQCGGMGVGVGIDSDDPAAPIMGRVGGLACLDWHDDRCPSGKAMPVNGVGPGRSTRRQICDGSRRRGRRTCF